METSGRKRRGTGENPEPSPEVELVPKWKPRNSDLCELVETENSLELEGRRAMSHTLAGPRTQ